MYVFVKLGSAMYYADLPEDFVSGELNLQSSYPTLPFQQGCFKLERDGESTGPKGDHKSRPLFVLTFVSEIKSDEDVHSVTARLSL